MLDRQINLFKVDTNAFLFPEENEQRKYLIKLKKVRESFYKTRIDNRESDINQTVKKLEAKRDNGEELKKYEEALIRFTDVIKKEEVKWKNFILNSAAENVKYNDTHKRKKIRQLNESYLSYIDKYDGYTKVNLTNVVSMFESTLSRSFGIQRDELTYDIFIVEIYYYDIAQDIILNGFDYNGSHYVYFSSSAGQIRTKKAVFVNEEKYAKCEPKLMCGLTVDKINECGGMNINKYLAYLALSNSATDLWEDVFDEPFDIDRCIVIDDFETDVECTVDHINYQTYEITPGVKEFIPIPHSDGCGLISSDYCSKNFMVRLPWIKGLLGSFDFKRFIIENNCSPIVKDLWGKEYDIIQDDIKIIFTKSQLKMYKFYSSWDEYKQYYRQYNCEAGICNIEENKITNAKINYQMLQTLYDATDDEIKDLCSLPNKKIKEISDSVENALDFFGINLYDTDDIRKDWFQKSLKIYPELLTDPANKQDLKDLKNSLVKKYRGGKLDVYGKFTFVLPDLYAFCEWLFEDIKAPQGLLENNEVFCRLYKNSEELDCLRSPHLYVEHAVRKNVFNKKYRNQNLREWFQTDAIYTSTHDPISRILQFDVDGDKLLVISQKRIIEMAKRCMTGVYPLYYEMKKATAEEINPHSLYKGLELAFTGGRIGGISNNITKIWNSPNINDEARNSIKWLCMETNFTIDYAKTLFKPTRPSSINSIISSYTRNKVPYFFIYAKDKEERCVEPVNNSMMNRIGKEIKDNKNMFYPINQLEKIDYRLFLKDKIDLYENDELNQCFNKWNRKYGNNLNIDAGNTDKNNIVAISNQVKEDLHRIELDDNKILNSLVNFLYKNPSERKKKLFWYMYGEQLYNNLLENLSDVPFCYKCGRRTKEPMVNHKCFKCRQKELKEKGFKLIKCVDCGKEIKISPKSRTIRCDDCKDAERKLHNQKMYENRKFNQVRESTDLQFSD